ncbi:hypothetical protein BDF21DRAFT_491181 [Thamnidium elegans]|uniref:Zn(2)-C6 fungal-type domain-containing protein n=1 Tax=Thamnidium elegans TaxID=101142 RepID=A0A8H7VYV3_9FUNG|nr:hypothetical protein INT48_002239 [Thamnidium elegans]KAI8090840.1 hypothetical protein BDF21DRAFT_491181 [Thamnidium elegans]
MNTFAEYTFDNKVQLLLQQKYNIENISSPSDATANNIVNSNNKNNDQPVTNMSLNDLSKPKRRQVKNACVNCQKACKKCDEGRPCQRCVKYNLTETCQDSVRKERKKGVKRGPYKRGRLVQSLGERVNKKVLKKQDTKVLVSTTTEDDGSMYPHKLSATQMSVLPNNNKCDSTNEYVTPPPPSAICSSQNNLSGFTTSSPYHNNQFSHPDSIVYNNNNIMGEYHHDRNNNNVNMMPSPMSNHIDTMATNGQSPQHCPPVPQEHNLVDMYSFYNSHIRHEQNSLNMYGTPVGSPVISSAHNPDIALNTDFVVDLSWQPPNTEKFYTNFYCQ